MQNHKLLPSIDYLRSRLRLGDDGVVYWREYKGNGFIRAMIGKPAGRIYKTSRGQSRRLIRLGKLYVFARIVYALHNGIDPGQRVVDHIDGDTLNDHPSNLRPATTSENLRNRLGPQVNNDSGFRGVSEDPHGKFYVRVGKRYIGRYATREEAAMAAEGAREKQFGEFKGGSTHVERVRNGQ